MNQAVLDLEKAIKEDKPGLMRKFAEKINEIFFKDPNHLPIEQILKTDLIEILIEFLKKQNSGSGSHIREFLRVLVNITSAKGSSVIEKLVDLDIIKIASGFAQHEDFLIRENALIVLANIAGENMEFRDQIIEEESEKILQAILSEDKDRIPVSFWTDLSWFLGVLFRDSPSQHFELVSQFLLKVSLIINSLVDSFCSYYPRASLEI